MNGPIGRKSLRGAACLGLSLAMGAATACGTMAPVTVSVPKDDVVSGMEVDEPEVVVMHEAVLPRAHRTSKARTTVVAEHAPPGMTPLPTVQVLIPQDEPMPRGMRTGARIYE